MIMALFARVLSLAFKGTLAGDKLLIILLLIALKTLSSFLSSKFAFKTTALIKMSFREKIFKKLFEIKDKYLNVLSSSEITQITSEGVDQLESYFGNYIPQFFYAIIAPITLFIVVLPINMPSALILFVLVPFIPLVIILIQKWAKRLLKKYWDQYTKLGDTFLEDLEGLTTLKLYEADEDYQRKMDREAENFRKITMKVLTMQLNSISIMDLVAYGGAALGIVVALVAFKNNSLMLDEAIFIILISADFFLPMRLLGSFFHIAMNGMASSDKIFKLLDVEIEEDLKDSFDPDGDIELENVSFKYDKRKIIEDVSFKIKKGSLTSIVGPSGSGKSTLASLINRNLKAQKGRIKIADQDLLKISPDAINKHLTYVGADSYIFKGTLKEELLIADQKASNEKLWEVLKKVKLDEYFQNLDGLDTKILEGGKNLSGGQRQRLALARALLHDSTIYIFDEATSNIDMESEEAIMSVIHNLNDKTIILISHRLANVISSDMIITMEDGKIKESGTHEELLKKKGLYQKLYLKQNSYEKYMMEGIS